MASARTVGTVSSGKMGGSDFCAAQVSLPWLAKNSSYVLIQDILTIMSTGRSAGYRVEEEREVMMTGQGHAPPSHARCLAHLGDWATALAKPNYDHDHRNDEEDVDEASERVGGDQP